MTANNDHQLKQWTADWQAAPYDGESAERIRRYVKRHTGLFWSFAVADFVIAAVALPVLLYLGITSRSDVERVSMLALASITVAAVLFGWWNRRGVLRSSATTIVDYIAISAERLRRMRVACRIGWVVLLGEVIAFTFWIWERLYSGRRDVTSGEERFAWIWLGSFTVMAIIGLIAFERWLSREADRFAALKRELSRD